MIQTKSIFLLLAAFILVGSSTIAQKLSSGTITMELTEVSSDNEQAAAGLEMMKGSSTKYIFNDKYSVSTMEMMGGMFKTTTRTDLADQKTDMLMDMMGNKMHVSSTKEERDALSNDSELAEMLENIEIVKHDETKEIKGYTCKKITIEPKGDDNEFPMEFTIYVTEDIALNSNAIQQFQGFDFSGFPLEFTIETPMANMTYTATEVSDQVDEKVFELKTAGYQKLTMEEFQEQMKGMGGGFGF